MTKFQWRILLLLPICIPVLVWSISSMGQTNIIYGGRVSKAEPYFQELQKGELPTNRLYTGDRSDGTRTVPAVSISGNPIAEDGKLKTKQNYIRGGSNDMGFTISELRKDDVPNISFRTNIVPVAIHGVDLKRFVQLSREFAAEPPAWREAVTWSEYRKRVQSVSVSREEASRMNLGSGQLMPIPPIPPDNNETPEGLRARAATLEAMIETQKVDQAHKKKVSEERQARWKEYQEMLAKLEEAVK